MKRRSFAQSRSDHDDMLQVAFSRGNAISPTPLMAFCDTANSRKRRAKGSLCILLQPTPDGDPSDELLERLLQLIEDAFYDTPGSATRGLRSALIAANSAVYEHNVKTLEAAKLLVGINLALVRDGEVYFSCIGPAYTLVVGSGEAQRFPERSVWLDSPGPSAYEQTQDPPAGLREQIEPSLASAPLGPNDTLLMCSPWAASMLTDQTAAGGLDPSALTARAASQARTVLFARGPLAGGAQSSPVASVDQPPLPSDPHERVEAPHPAPPVEPAPEPGLSVERPQPAISRYSEPEPVHTDAVPPEPEPDTFALPPWEEPSQPIAPPSPEPYEPDKVEIAPGPVHRPAPGQRIDLGDLRADVSNRASRLKNGAGQTLDRLLPTGLPQRPAVADKASSQLALSGKALVLIAMVIPLVMVFIVVMMRVQYTRIRKEQFESVQSLALSKYDAALQSDSTAYRRQGLYDALATAEEGLAIAPDDEDLGDLKRRILHELDSVDNIERLYHFWRLTPLDDLATSPTDGSRIVLHDIDLYLLNRGSDTVYRFLLNAAGDALQEAQEATPLIAKGDRLGGIQVGDLVDIAWLDDSGRRKEPEFVALERNGSLIGYDPQYGLALHPVANSDTWLKPQALGGYMGNLYILDPLLGRIFKYEPENDAYTNSPGDYVRSGTYVDLTGAVDMAIDGHVYLLYADGQVLKLYEGNIVPFAIQGLPTPMKSPCAICASGDPESEDDEGYLYIADAGNERIVQLTKEGQYVRQFRENTAEGYLGNLQGIHVDETSQRMFIVSNGALWLARVPDLNE